MISDESSSTEWPPEVLRLHVAFGEVALEQDRSLTNPVPSEYTNMLGFWGRQASTGVMNAVWMHAGLFYAAR
jgi:hypothetical protein